MWNPAKTLFTPTTANLTKHSETRSLKEYLKKSRFRTIFSQIKEGLGPIKTKAFRTIIRLLIFYKIFLKLGRNFPQMVSGGINTIIEKTTSK